MKKRNKNTGRYEQDRRIYGIFMIVTIIISFSFIGLNTIWSWAKSLEKTFVVENSKAEEVIHITWQDEVMYMLKEAGIDMSIANKVVACESNWKKDSPKAWNTDGSNDLGLWRLNSVHGLSDEIRLDPITATVH